MTYAKGDRVRRLEDRAVVGAVVLTAEDGFEGQILELSYDEGGTGWWPADALEPDDAS
jgi:hypothetical protein